MQIEIFKTKSELANFLSSKQDQKIGFVPTMGALHQGHLELVKRCISENDISIVSIFINKLQFNDINDYNRYPRNIEKDIALLKNINCNAIFIPEHEEIYPEKTITEKYDFGYLETIMEGKYRPGHFNGVAIVVNRLFEIIKPHNAYFGEKDYQQLLIVKKLVELKKHKINIIACPTVREPDGLAMSSRNLLLSEEERKVAPFIYNTLCKAKSLISSETPQKIKQIVFDDFSSNKYFKIEYFEIADAQTLLPVDTWENHNDIVMCIAAYLGIVRLIDNIIIKDIKKYCNYGNYI